MKFRQTLKQLPRSMWILCAATLVNRAGTMVLPFLVLYLTRSLQISPSMAGAILALYGVGAFITAPVAGRLCDRYGAVKIMKISLIASGFVFFLYPVVRSIETIAIATLLLAFTSEMFRPASLAAVTQFVTPEQRKASFAVLRLAINVGMSVGPALGGYLAQWSFHSLFIIDGVTSILAGTVLTFFFYGTPSYSTEHEEQVSATQQTFSSIPHRAAWSDLTFLYFLAALLPALIVFFQDVGAMPLFLVQDLHLPETLYGLLFTINTILIILIEVPLNLAMARWSYRHTLGAGAFLTALGFGVLFAANHVWIVIASVVIWTFGEMILFPSSAAYVSHLAPMRRQGEYMGLYTMCFSFAFMIGPWLGTAIMERLGGQLLWIIMFFVGAVSSAMLLFVRERLQVPAA